MSEALDRVTDAGRLRAGALAVPVLEEERQRRPDLDKLRRENARGRVGGRQPGLLRPGQHELTNAMEKVPPREPPERLALRPWSTPGGAVIRTFPTYRLRRSQSRATCRRKNGRFRTGRQGT